MTKLGWAIIGTGRHADRFIAPAISKSASGQLIAIMSRDLERGRHFAARHGDPSVYGDLEALLADSRVDAVFISSPNHVHKEQVLLAAQARKHVLCEKPLALNVDDCRTMIGACRHARIHLGVGFHLRYNPVHGSAKELIAGGAIGQVLFVHAQYMHVTAGEEGARKSPAWRMDPSMAGGGSFMGTGVHAIDLFRFVLGKEITHVFALVDDGWCTSGRERLMHVSLLLEGHLVGSVTAGTMKYPTNHFVLYGTSGTLSCNGSIGNYGGGRLELTSHKGVQSTSFGLIDVYEREVDAFADTVQRGVELNGSGLDGLRNAEATAGIYESLHKKTLIELTRSNVETQT